MADLIDRLTQDCIAALSGITYSEDDSEEERKEKMARPIRAAIRAAIASQKEHPMPRLTMDNLIGTVQGCDGYSMDLGECAQHYGVTPDELKKFAADGPPWLITGTYEDTGEEYIACDGE